MTDTGPSTPPSSEGENPNLEQLRAKAAEADELRAELRRRDEAEAFSGIDITQGPGKLLKDAYKPEDGKFTRAGLAAFAEQYGMDVTKLGVKDPAATEGDPAPRPDNKMILSPEEARHQQLSDSISSSGGEPNPDTGDVFDKAYGAFDGEMKSGKTREKAATAMVGTIFTAAAEGNKQVLYDQAEWRERNS